MGTVKPTEVQPAKEYKRMEYLFLVDASSTMAESTNMEQAVKGL